METIMDKTEKMAQTLAEIMSRYCIQKNEYMIIASYGLKCVREISDLDVGISKRGFGILKEIYKDNIKNENLSNDESIVIYLPDFGENAEIEIFELETRGFPTDKYSLPQLLEHGKLIKDKFGNNYLNVETIVSFYSDISRLDEKIYNGNYPINTERLEKNIAHLKLLCKHLNTKTKSCSCSPFMNDSFIKCLKLKLVYLRIIANQ